MLNKELSHFSESSRSGNQISEYICSTFLGKFFSCAWCQHPAFINIHVFLHSRNYLIVFDGACILNTKRPVVYTANGTLRFYCVRNKQTLQGHTINMSQAPFAPLNVLQSASRTGPLSRLVFLVKFIVCQPHTTLSTRLKSLPVS